MTDDLPKIPMPPPRPSRKVITIGTGRNGTRTMAAYFAQLPDVVSLHEPSPQLGPVVGSKMVNDLKILKPEFLRHFRGKATETRYYCEAAAWFSWLIPEAKLLWPDVCFIYITRDLWPWAKSAHRRGWYTKDLALHLPDFEVLRPEPTADWPSGVDRWFKLAWCHKVYDRLINHELNVHGCEWTRTDVTALSSLKAVNALVGWAGLPGQCTELKHENAGKRYVTWGEMKQRGLDKKHRLKPSFSDLKRFYVDADPEKGQVAIEGLTFEDVYPEEPTPEIQKSLDDGTALAWDEPIHGLGVGGAT